MAQPPRASTGVAPSRWTNPSYLVVLLMVVAAILRISFIDSKSLWLDESLSAHRATLSLSELWKVIFNGHMNMSVYYLMLNGWASIAGTSEFMLRLPSAIFDVATVGLIFTLGVELGDRRAGLLAALMVTVNATCIECAQTARSYAMYVALATLSSIFFIGSLKRNTESGYLASYVASAIGTVYTQLFGIFALLSQRVSLFLFRSDRKAAIRLTACITIVGLLSLPALYFSIFGHHGHQTWIPPTSLHSLKRSAVQFRRRVRR